MGARCNAFAVGGRIENILEVMLNWHLRKLEISGVE